MPLLPPLEAYLAARDAERQRIPAERRERLDRFAEFIAARAGAGGPVRALFVCTHNSRRSHIAHLFAQAAAWRCGSPQFEGYSAGTEATAVAPGAVAALRRAGFAIERAGEGTNPLYRARYAADAPPATCFSKVLSHPENPTREFAAVMVCDSADEACPHVAGAAARFVIPYEDPKRADGTAHESEAYDACCAAISREMLYVFAGAGRRGSDDPRAG